MSLKIVDETVYVIYKNGVPYEGDGRKLVYTSTGAANGVITKEAKRDAERNYTTTRNYLTDIDWYELGWNSREYLIDRVKEEFTIVEYGPKERN
jgi:hypothetical protein